jgi:hypothetical protein
VTAAGGARAGPAAALGALLAVLVLALQLPAAARVAQAWSWPGLPAEMLLPGLFHEEDEPALPWLTDERLPAQVHLPLASLRETDADDHEARLDSVTVGFLPLLLAALGLCVARGGWAIAGRALLAGGVLLPLADAWLPLDDAAGTGTLLLVAGLSLLAGTGLASLRPREPDGRGETPAVLLGSAAVLAAGALAMLALGAGASSDDAVTAPLLERADAASPTDLLLLHDPAIVAANAAWLRAVLDRAALAAFVGMAALLLHLRSRGAATGALLLLAVAADLLSVRLLL